MHKGERPLTEARSYESVTLIATLANATNVLPQQAQQLILVQLVVHTFFLVLSNTWVSHVSIAHFSECLQARFGLNESVSTIVDLNSHQRTNSINKNGLLKLIAQWFHSTNLLNNKKNVYDIKNLIRICTHENKTNDQCGNSYN